ncbi:MAG: isochorismatase family protein [Gammaproteobacteria bacterium]|nr:isochorismatase family protein [Gammaproteobacteria bacterium]MDH3372518.1 isochorismatase family protein [Gammaproteobacteria bacterium]MDH3409292.1 isochorismatase family protein [Gammaproteobacteria bacterium]MDH3554030.1 isochorismatase family protein [Gammaproteobacteria bacterium]
MSDDLTENYRGAFDGSLGFGKMPALILVDFVEAYFDKSSALYAGAEDALASALRIRDAARNAGVPVFYTNVVYQQGGADGGVFYRKVPALEAFVQGNPLGRWPEGLVPAEDERVISKQYPSAFFGTTLADELTARGIDTLIITGLTTSGCIRATCVDAMSHGFIPIVVADACGDRHQAPHDANLFDMNAKYADVVDEQTVIDYLRGL